MIARARGTLEVNFTVRWLAIGVKHAAWRAQQVRGIIVLSILRRLGLRFLILASVGLVAAIAFWYFAIRTLPIPQRTLRIGFEQVPPVQIRTRNGFSGLAVDTVSEAAKR